MNTKVMFHWGTWIANDTPITGAVSCNSLEWIHDEVNYGDSINLSYDGAWEEFKREKIAAWEEERSEEENSSSPDEDTIAQWEEEFSSSYEEMGDTYLVGQWELGEDGKYGPAQDCEFAAIVDYDTNVAQVVRSKYVTPSALCSPCYPGQGDLDNAGEWYAYDFPLDMYGEFRQNEGAQITIAEFLDLVAAQQDSPDEEEI